MLRNFLKTCVFQGARGAPGSPGIPGQAGLMVRKMFDVIILAHVCNDCLK